MGLLRNTIQRQLVLDAVHVLHNHPSADEIYQFIQTEHPNISKGTVYRNLKVLVQTGEIQNVVIPSAAERYDYNLHPHYHIQCRICQSIYDVDMPYMNNMDQMIQGADGFRIEGHELVFKGVCAHCTGR